MQTVGAGGGMASLVILVVVVVTVSDVQVARRRCERWRWELLPGRLWRDETVALALTSSACRQRQRVG